MFDIWSDKQNALMHSIQDSTYSLSKHWKYNFEKDTNKIIQFQSSIILEHSAL